VPLEEIRRHLQTNLRQDVKVVAPELLSEHLFQRLSAKGKKVKPEVELDGDRWSHSTGDHPNCLCASADFITESLPQYACGPFAMSFANERAEQDAHYHRRHVEIYFSEHPLQAEFWLVGSVEQESISLAEGGAIIFSPNVVHSMRLGGLTIVLELPSVADDKALDV